MHDSTKHTPVQPALRLVSAAAPRAIARVDLSRPGSAEALRELADDWLYETVGEDGKRKLLREHDLLAA